MKQLQNGIWKVKAFIITMSNNAESLRLSTKICKESILTTNSCTGCSALRGSSTTATLRSTMSEIFEEFVRWSYPEKDTENQTRLSPRDLFLKAYQTSRYQTSHGMFTESHETMEVVSADNNETVVVLEHDAFFRTYFQPR